MESRLTPATTLQTYLRAVSIAQTDHFWQPIAVGLQPSAYKGSRPASAKDEAAPQLGSGSYMMRYPPFALLDFLLTLRLVMAGSRQRTS